MGYLDLQAQRPGYTYIDPTTGEEKAYEKVYAPEQAGRMIQEWVLTHERSKIKSRWYCRNKKI